ncbi:YfhO family protein, partial [bacterium]|nr:YfhO family protein [bacterium]
KIFLIGAVASIALFLIVLVGGNALQGAFGSFEKPGEYNQYMQQLLSRGVPQAQAQSNVMQYIGNLRLERFALLRTDLLWVLIFLALAFTAAFLKLTGKISRTPFIIAVLAISAIDIWLFSHKFFGPQPPESAEQMFPKDSVVQYLEQDSSLYRVFPAGRLLQDNSWNYFAIQSLGGYHGVKMRAYQDMQDNLFYNGPNARFPLHLPLLSSLNCKYILTDTELGTVPTLKPVIWNQQGHRYLYENLRALPRAYFVDSVAVIPDRDDALRALQRPNFQPDYWAVVDHDLPGPISPTPNRSATVTSYETHEVTIKVETDRPSFMVLSDAHYAPGWKAMVDGKTADIYLVNTFVRGLYLNEGKHHVRFFYRQRSLQAGIGIATISHFVIWALIGWGWWISRKSKKKASS